mmetsp:Transcript_12396/g.14077  ORF Transcript_12396/g.14077 Transcript_12396/m.14077 type:complete len:292 (+) Transcript_12396:129-1004(+)
MQNFRVSYSALNGQPGLVSTWAHLPAQYAPLPGLGMPLWSGLNPAMSSMIMPQMVQLKSLNGLYDATKLNPETIFSNGTNGLVTLKYQPQISKPAQTSADSQLSHEKIGSKRTLDTDTKKDSSSRKRKKNFGNEEKKKSGYRGVFWNSRSRVWVASITLNGNKKHLGVYDDEKTAAIAYDKEALQLKGPFAIVNFSDSAKRFLKVGSTKGNDDLTSIIESKRRQRKTAEKVSKYRGVCWNKYNQSWKSCIKVDGKNKHLGYFSCEIEAAKTYDASALLHRGKKAKLNFPKA